MIELFIFNLSNITFFRKRYPGFADYYNNNNNNNNSRIYIAQN